MSCPICERESNADFRPFCSKRCADVDLAKWLTGAYAVPADDTEDATVLADELSAEDDRRKPH